MVEPSDVGTRFEGPLRAAIGLALLGLLVSCGQEGPDPEPRRFETPDAAAAALIDALEQTSPNPLLQVLGYRFREQLVTADWDVESEERRRIAAAARTSLELSKIAPDEVHVLVGPDGWPFPSPILRDGSSWHFDTARGLVELIDRRVGKNELSAIALLRAYVEAQTDYARVDRDGDDVLEFAQRLGSSPGKRDGLYWPSEDEDDLSPFGSLVEGAESYAERSQPGDPFFGYYFTVLTKQGANPPGGRYDYVVNGHMIAGFGLVAHPAQYGVTGVMTFAVNHRGKVHEKDLGPFSGMSEYDPDDSWRLVED